MDRSAGNLKASSVFSDSVQTSNTDPLSVAMSSNPLSTTQERYFSGKNPDFLCFPSPTLCSNKGPSLDLTDEDGSEPDWPTLVFVFNQRGKGIRT
ncbi:hypothetical protein MRB53_023382 [Persea americana]|uniref:Uncharacterized protein n=1 Tax=Persea americana TaxID=3435 RepID=A0ACC2LAI2_PERAE|nr:hypothetical protein MRB53_023382 [Persea americana]